MNFQELFYALSKASIPLADIRILFDDYFHFDFNDIGNHGKERSISNDEAEFVISKLTSGFPVNYLVGSVNVRGLTLFLNEWILIPRTETIEFLYDTIKHQYDFNGKKVLDLCCGSGVIGLSVKKLFPESIVTLSDNYDPVLEIAERNANENDLEVDILKSDYLSDIHDVFDVIISNPPYIEEGSLAVDAPFEPKTALYGGKDGLDAYRKIFRDLDSRLAGKGISFFEIESTNSKNTMELAKQMLPNYRLSLLQDMEKKDRYLIAEKD